MRDRAKRENVCASVTNRDARLDRSGGFSPADAVTTCCSSERPGSGCKKREPFTLPYVAGRQARALAAVPVRRHTPFF